MKYLISLFLLSFSTIVQAQQKAYPCRLIILDATTHLPVSNASVVIDQAVGRQKTDENGLCEFRKVPEGRIDCDISHLQYHSQRIQFSVSSEVKNNSFRVYLTPNSDNALVIYGKIKDSSGNGLVAVNIEAKVDGLPYSSLSDSTGNYRFEIPATTFRKDEIQLEFKKGSCHHSDIVTIPSSLLVQKDITINCIETGVENPVINMDGEWLLQFHSEQFDFLNNTHEASLSFIQKGFFFKGRLERGSFSLCSGAIVFGKITSDGIELRFEFTEKCCRAEVITIKAEIKNENLITGVFQPDLFSLGNCSLPFGTMTLSKKF